MIDTLVNNGQQALQALESFTQEEIDNIVHEMALAGVDRHMPLANWQLKKLAVVYMKTNALKIFLPLNIFGIV